MNIDSTDRAVIQGLILVAFLIFLVAFGTPIFSWVLWKWYCYWGAYGGTC